MDAALTMERPAFNNRTHPVAAWSDAEIRAWIGRTKANPGDTPWRLQWLEDAEEVLAARALSGAGV